MNILFVVKMPESQRSHFATVQLASAFLQLDHEVSFMSFLDFTRNAKGELSGQTVTAGGPASPEDLAEALFHKRLTAQAAPLNTFDLVLLRNNPEERFSALEHYMGNAALPFALDLKALGKKVINCPKALLEMYGKDFLKHMPQDHQPQTLVTRNVDEAKAFIQDLGGHAVIKPLLGFGGRNVFAVGPQNADQLFTLIEVQKRDGYFLVQEKLNGPEKRVLLVNGEVFESQGQAAVYERIRPKGEVRGNLHVGGQAGATKLTDVERELCQSVGELLKAKGLLWAGVDLMGEKVLEVNVHTPGGLASLEKLYGQPFSKDLALALLDLV